MDYNNFDQSIEIIRQHCYSTLLHELLGIDYLIFCLCIETRLGFFLSDDLTSLPVLILFVYSYYVLLLSSRIKFLSFVRKTIRKPGCRVGASSPKPLQQKAQRKILTLKTYQAPPRNCLSPMTFSSLSFVFHKEWGKTTTKTEVVEPVAGTAPVAICATGVPGIAKPSATNVQFFLPFFYQWGRRSEN